jgi:ribonuclease P protein component
MREAPVPTQQPKAQEDARFPHPHAHPRRSGRHQVPASTGPRPALGLIRSVRDRATFEALARARRRSGGVVTLRFVRGDRATPARVAVATSRSSGNAVTRNRVRRRLRAAAAAHRDELVGGAYLFGGGREAASVSFESLSAAVGGLIRSVRKEGE